ncbi:hypothetical protein NDU88_008684 [Pleurodeles waltl]|uniref:Uncharacterized protein n=1 Tax=Pleurodeles waltl TaxID=8319 RepID=A0AAV7QQF1_PLEWA|nr:hypothetical protein NDU88_008684 [Pleurodeles waltl]
MSHNSLDTFCQRKGLKLGFYGFLCEQELNVEGFSFMNYGGSRTPSEEPKGNSRLLIGAVRVLSDPCGSGSETRGRRISVREEADADSGPRGREETSGAPDRSTPSRADEHCRTGAPGTDGATRREVPSPPPSVPSGNRGCRRPRESTKEEGGDTPQSSVFGAPENGQEPEARRNERRGPTLEATERRWRR